MSTVPTRTVLFLFETRFMTTAITMIVFSRREFLTCARVIIGATVFETTPPAPGTTTACPLHKGSAGFKATGKNIITCVIFQTPALTPRALLCIVHSTSESGKLTSACSRESYRPRYFPIIPSFGFS